MIPHNGGMVRMSSVHVPGWLRTLYLYCLSYIILIRISISIISISIIIYNSLYQTNRYATSILHDDPYSPCMSKNKRMLSNQSI
jgi:hypothetical protein